MKFRNFILAIACALSAGVVTPFYTSFEERDLELFSAPSHSHKGFVSLFSDKCRTAAGRQALNVFFQEPLIESSPRAARQNAVKTLSSDDAFASISALCEKVRDNESALETLLGFDANPAFHDVIKTFYFNWVAFKGLNKSSVALNALYYGELMTQLGPIFEHILLHNVLNSCGHDHSRDKKESAGTESHVHAAACCHGHEHSHHEHEHTHEHGHGCTGHHNHIEPSKLQGLCQSEPSGIMAAVNAMSNTWDSGCRKLQTTIQAYPRVWKAITLAHLPILAFSLMGSMQFNSERRITVDNIHRELVRLAAVVAQVRELSQKCVAVSGLELYAVQITELLKNDALLNECVKALESSIFKKHTSTWVLSPVGKTLSTLMLVLKNQDGLKKLIACVGEIDALRAASEVVRTAKMPWTYTHFVENAVPVVSFEGMRNPLLQESVSVSNNCSWGADSDSHVVLTGPNRAGKTTYLKALAYNVLLSHVFGIAAAQSATMTPFKGLVTFMSLNDDLVNNQSRYVAQIVRMESIVSRVNECKEGEFMLVLLDDSVGQGSTQEVNESKAYEFFKLFEPYKNIIFLGATHFAHLTSLEAQTQGGYKNYRMRVIPSENGSQALSSYVVEPGIADFGQILSLVS